VPSQVRRGGLWAKHMRLKRVAIGNTLGEHIGNLMRTNWELEGNKGKMKKIKALLRLPIGCKKFSISKTVGHHFRPGLINSPIIN